MFHCSPNPVEQAFELACLSAVAAAKPLTLPERRAAALRLIATRPDLSDRGIALISGLSRPSVGKLRRGTTDDQNFTPPDSGRPRGTAQDAALLDHRFLGTLARRFAAEEGDQPGEQIGGLIAGELISEDDPEVAGLVAHWLTMLAESVRVRVRAAYPEKAEVRRP